MPLPPLHTERAAAEASARGATPASAFGNDAARPEPDEGVGQLQRGRPHTGTHWHCWRWVTGRHMCDDVVASFLTMVHAMPMVGLYGLTRACVLAPAGRGEPYRYVPCEGCIKK